MESAEGLPKLNLQSPFSFFSHPRLRQEPPAWVFTREGRLQKEKKKKEALKKKKKQKKQRKAMWGGGGRAQLLLRACLVQDQVYHHHHFCSSCCDCHITTSLMMIAEICLTFFIYCLLLKHLFFICIFIFDFSEYHIWIPALKALLCWRQICFPLVFRAIPKPNVQINLKPEVYAH